MTGFAFKISPIIAEQHRITRDLKGYAVWIYLKALYRNSCIYNYTVLGLSRKSGLSRSTLRKYMPKFLAWGWCRTHGRNLVFCKHDLLPEKKKKCLMLVKLFACEWSIKSILAGIEAFLVANSQRQQRYATTRGDKRYRAASRENLQGMAFPLSKAAKLFRCSFTTASRKLRRLAAFGYFNRVHKKARPAYFDVDINNPNWLEHFVTADAGDKTFVWKGRLYKAYLSLIDWLPSRSQASPYYSLKQFAPFVAAPIGNNPINM